MSATTVLSFVKDIAAGDLAAVRARLDAKQPANQRYTDPKAQDLTYTLLHKAVGAGHAEIAGVLLAAGADANAADSRGRTPLHWAAQERQSSSGQLAAAALLLEQPGVAMHAQDSSKATPLHAAAAAGNAALLKLLLAHGADATTTAPGFSILHAACCRAEQGAAVGSSVAAAACCRGNAARCAPGTTPPPAAALYARTPGSQKALAGATPAAATAAAKRAPQQPPPCRPAATAAAIRKLKQQQAQSASSLGRRQAAASANLAVPAAAAAPGGAGCEAQPARDSPLSLDAGVLDAVLAAAPQLLQQQDAAGFTPLMRLVQRGAWADAAALLARGDCGVSAASSATGDTALHLLASCAMPDAQLAAALVAAGADAGAQRRSDGSSALLLAVKASGDAGLALTQALLAPHQPTASTSASTSTSTSSSGVVQRASPRLQDSGDTPQARGATCGIDAANAAGETAVGVAAAGVLRSLEAGGSSHRDGGSTGAQQLLSLVLSRRPAVPQQLAASLLQQGLAGRLPDRLTAQVVGCLTSTSEAESAASQAAGAADRMPGSISSNSSTSSPQAASHEGLLAASMHHTAVALLLKRSGRDAAAQGAAGNTLLHEAAATPSDQPQLAAALLDAGVPPNAANGEHDTALHIAARQGHVEMCRALVEGGADVLRRNGRNRTPGTQLKLSEGVKAYMQGAEAAARAAKEAQRHALYDEKMRATQTQSAALSGCV